MTAWITRLRFSRKFALIGALAVVLFLVPTVMVLSFSLDKMAVAKRESLGLAPAADLLRLLQKTQQHRGLAAAELSGTAAAAANRQQRQKEVEDSLAQARAGILRLEDPALLPRLDRVAADWKALAAAVAGQSLTGPQSNRQHAALIAREIDLIDDVANSSGLSLDPEAGTYHVQRAALSLLPQLTELLGQARARGAVMLSRGEVSPEDRVRLEVLFDRVRQIHDAAHKALDLAADGGSLPPAVLTARAAAKAAVGDSFQLAEKSTQMTAADWIAAMTRDIDAQYALMTASFDLLETSLGQQISALQRQLAVLLTVLATLCVVAFWVMAMVTRTTTRSLDSAVRLAEAVASGDLTVRVQPQGRDEVARLLTALQGMTARLGSVVGTVRQNSESVATASAQIAQGNADLSQRTEEQASALEQTAASMEELGSTVQHNADSAREASTLARDAARVAEQGGAAVQQVVQTMQGIHASSGRIADIIGVIDGIAFQTNILALNAAVEAARAGEQGRGFAVVAGEVRALAGRSAEAAREIKSLISDSVNQVGDGNRLVAEAGATMEQVVGAIRQVSELVDTISAATAEQSTGISQVGDAVAQMDTTTQQNAALVEESAAAANSLNGQARQLVQAVSVFRLA